jgi:hypothetical protein
MITFFIGFFIGVWVGALAMSLLAAARRRNLPTKESSP